MTTYLISKRRWRKGPKSNIIVPAKTHVEDKTLSIASSSTMAIQSPSALKQLFPSLSIFNLGGPQSPTSPTDPPPQFAANQEPSPIKKHLKRLRKKRIQEAYPSAFETYLFDDLQPGVPAQGIRPVRLLLERLEAWHLLSQRLLQHFELVASIESNIAKQYRKLEQVMIFPTPSDGPQLHYRRQLTRSGCQKLFHRDQRLLQCHFAFTGGIRSVCDAWQNYHVNSASDHAAFATFLRSNAVATLSNIKQELKWMIKSIRSDDRLSLTPLTELKKEASKRLKRLDKQLNFFDKHPFYGYTKKDPWLMNASVVKQMIKVYCQENIVHETVLRLQKEILVSEEQLVEEFRHLCQHIYNMREQSSLGADRGLDGIIKTFDQIKMDSDWINFCQHHNEHLVSEKAAYRHPDSLQYPNHTHALLQPVFAARMERRSTVLHQWHEYMYVLTLAGFLHEYRDVKNYPAKPDNTIFIPHYKVSTLSTNLHHSLIFQLQPHAASRNMLNGYPMPKNWNTSKSRWGLKDRFTWTLRAKSAADMEKWIDDLTNTSERYRSMPCVEHPLREEGPEPGSATEDPVSESSQEETTPDPKPEEEAAPEPTPEEAAPDPAPSEEAIPDSAPSEEATPEPTPEEATPEPIPEEPTSESIPEKAAPEPTPESTPESSVEESEKPVTEEATST